MASDPGNEPVLWAAMEARRKSFRPVIHPSALCHDRTRRKIKRGIVVRDDVYDHLDTVLRWVPTDARRAALKGIPPRPLEAEGVSSARRLLLASLLSEAVVLAAAAPDLPDETLEAAVRAAREVLGILGNGR